MGREGVFAKCLWWDVLDCSTSCTLGFKIVHGTSSFRPQLVLSMAWKALGAQWKPLHALFPVCLRAGGHFAARQVISQRVASLGESVVSQLLQTGVACQEGRYQRGPIAIPRAHFASQKWPSPMLFSSGIGHGGRNAKKISELLDNQSLAPRLGLAIHH